MMCSWIKKLYKYNTFVNHVYENHVKIYKYTRVYPEKNGCNDKKNRNYYGKN